MPMNEHVVIAAVLKFNPMEIKKHFSLKTLDLDSNGLFISFDFNYNGANGFLNGTYDFNSKRFKSVNMDINFVRPAGHNNYPNLHDVINHVITNIK